MMAYPSSNPVVRITVATAAGNVTAKGRNAWALHELIECGLIGVTPIDRPAPRWAHYVFRLRGNGLNIETIDEAHGGAFSGSHARYVLRTPVTVVETVRQNDKRASSQGARSAQPVAA